MRVHLHPRTRQQCGPMWWGGSVSFLPRGKVQTGPRPQGREAPLTADWQRAGQAGVLHSGLPLKGLGLARLWVTALRRLGSWLGTVGSAPLGPGARGSVLGLLRTPLESMVLVGIRQDLVTHAPEHVGGGLCGNDDWFHHRWGQLADHAPHSACQPLLLVAP